MCNEEYNGWTNRETWSMNLWISNEPYWFADESLITFGKSFIPEDADNSTKARVLNELAEELHTFMDDEFSWENVKDNEKLYEVVREIGSLNRVNWHEIAEHYFSELE